MLKDEIEKINRDINLNLSLNNLSLGNRNIKLNSDRNLIIADNIQSLNYLLENNIKVKLAYLDPPYNTGKKFIYSDSAFSVDNSIWGNSKPWAEFMAIRLFILKKVLLDDGFVVMSIDDRELHNLIILSDYFFGRKNRFPTIVVKKNNNGKGSHKSIGNQHEYILIYGMSNNIDLNSIDKNSRESKEYDRSDEYGNYRINGLFRKKGADSLRTDRPNMYYPLYYDESGRVYVDFILGTTIVYPQDSKGVERRWLWGKDKAEKDQHLLYASKKGVIYVKDYDNENKLVKPRSVWESDRYFTQVATQELKKDFGAEGLFETPKALHLMEDVVSLIPIEDGDFILDVFCGSGSFSIAADKIFKQNCQDVSIISLESDFIVDKNHKAFDAGFERIADLTFARLKKHINNVEILYMN